MSELANVTDVVLTTTNSTVERLYEEVKRLLHGGKLTPTNVVMIMIDLMQIVDKYTELKGPQKKQVLLSALNMLIDDQNDNVEDVTDLKMLVKMTLPSVIDVIMSIDKKQLKIKTVKVWNMLLPLGCCGTKV
jgi:hypothetical protein